MLAKTCVSERPSVRASEKLREEFQLLSKLDVAGAPHPVHFHADALRPILVMEDPGGDPASDLSDNLPWSERLRVVWAIARSIEAVHGSDLIYRNLNPRSILFDSASGQAILLGFECVSERSAAAPDSPPDLVQSRLPYISPEQTGRVNRGVDHRADFYALGVIAFELFAGRLPFDVPDPVELVHSHIARQPELLDKVVEGVPNSIARVVAKLLAKDPDQRYQSASGLIYDLDQLLQILSGHSSKADFRLALRDVSDKLLFPDRLYGREREMRTLNDTVARIRGGASECVLLSGSTGVGKTALVEEMRKEVLAESGIYGAGKFDQRRRGEPYTALIEALALLVRELAAETESEFQRWKQKLRGAFGDAGSEMTAVIPDLEAITGPFEAAPDLPPREAQNRFKNAFEQFVRALCEPGHPLILFLDDLQWADRASLELIEAMTSADQTAGMLLICSYRRDEVDDAHPFSRVMKRLEAVGIRTNRLHLLPLELHGVTQLTADAMGAQSEACEPLARIISEKTGGNPFFVNLFLRQLCEDGDLSFDRVAGSWNWDLSRVRSRTVTENVASYTSDRLSGLDEDMRRVLVTASVVGAVFDVEDIAQLADLTIEECAVQLWSAVRENLIIPLAASAHGFIEDAGREARGGRFKFSHDQIQQACYALMSTEERAANHHQVGSYLTELDEVAATDTHLFEIVTHLNAAGGHADRRYLAEVNVKAGRKARMGAAYGPAYSYYRSALSLMDDVWDRRGTSMARAHIECAELAYLNADSDEMERLLGEVVSRSNNILDTVEVCEIRVQALIGQNRFLEAVDIGLEALAPLGTRLPRRAGKSRALLGFLATKVRLIFGDLSGLATADEVTDPLMTAERRLLKTLSSVTYLAAPDIFPLVVFRQVDLSVARGVTPESSYAFALFGISLCGVVGDLKGGQSHGELAIKLLERFEGRAPSSKVHFAVYYFIMPWVEPLRKMIALLVEGYQMGLESGDIEFATHNAAGDFIVSFFSGLPLDSVVEKLSSHGATARKLEQGRTVHLANLYGQVVDRLLGNTVAGTNYLHAETLSKHLEDNDVNQISHHYLCNLMTAFLSGEFEAALCFARDARPYVDEGFLGTFLLAEFRFYESLAILSNPQPGGHISRTDLRRLRKNQKKMKQWARAGSGNFDHKYWLVDAESKRVDENHAEAEASFGRAILLAEEGDFTNEAALAHELYARYCSNNRREDAAHRHARKALNLYHAWGAHSKVRALKGDFPFLTEADPERSAETEEGLNLDLTVVLRAAQAISREIELDSLLKRLMRTFLESAGADRGVMLLARADGFYVDAEGTTSGASVFQDVRLEAFSELPQSVVNYTVRLNETVLVEDAASDVRFRDDLYLKKNRPLSILCLPLTERAKVSGVLYLENRLTRSAFTPDRIEILDVLSTQAAISIRNALLFSDLENANDRLEEYSLTLESRVEQRSAELRKAQATLISKMEDELKTAHDLQMSLMPTANPNLDGLDIAGRWIPASHVGGDFYQYFQRKNSVSIALVDVSGKAMDAAIPVVMLDGVLESQMRLQQPLQDLFHALNDIFCKKLKARHFACLAMIEIDAATMKMNVVNGGCPSPYHYSEAEQTLNELESGIYPLGVRPETIYTTLTRQLQQGDRVVMLSDGLIEASGADGDQFGYQRTSEALLRACQDDLSAEQTIDYLLGESRRFCQKESFEDDLTCVVINVQNLHSPYET